MHNAASALITRDPIWDTICRETEQDLASEPLLAGFLHSTILAHRTLDEALSLHLAHKLGGPALAEVNLREIIAQALQSDTRIGQAVHADLEAVRDRDPACDRYNTPLLYFKGFHALQTYRVTHWLWNNGRIVLARCLQNRASEVFAVDIHPAARIGVGIMIDHATSVVIGETAVVGDNVSMLHEVTLGGTGKDSGDRHPKIGRGVLIGAGAKILGNVRIGMGAKIGAGSVVLDDVPAHCTVAGVPAVIVGDCCDEQPALSMDHKLTGPPTRGSGAD